MPGGSPIASSRSRKSSRSSRPCKYGPRDENGLCPKKPKAAPKPKKAKAAKAKAPCKYGPRDAQGHCPKKPKAERKVRELESVSAAGRQAGEVLRSKTATKAQKHEAVRVLGQAVAVESGKKVAEHIAREAKKAARTPAAKKAIATAVKKVLPAAATLGATGAGIAATVYVGGKALTANREREARAFAKRELANTKKRLTQKLTAEQERTLYEQYYRHALKQPVTNSFVGK